MRPDYEAVFFSCLLLSVAGVPAHDMRDLLLARKYSLPVLKVAEFEGSSEVLVDSWQVMYSQ